MGKALSITIFGWVVISLFTIISLQSCNQDDCGSVPQITLNGIELRNYAVQEKMSGQTQDEYKIDEYKEGQALSYDSILIRLELLVKAVSEQSFGMTSALACSPAYPFLEIVKITITSSEDYNSEYPSGKNLADIFNVQTDLSVSSKENISKRGRLNSYDRYYLSISIPPLAQSKHNFQISFTLQNSEVITLQTGDLLITQ